jgi:hypothetical protein
MRILAALGVVACISQCNVTDVIQTYDDSGKPHVEAPTGVKITNSNKPECSGMRVTGAGAEEYMGIEAMGLALHIENASGQRKWLRADVKIWREVHTYNVDQAGESWSAAGPFTMRPDERNGTFFVHRLEGPNDTTRITAVNVLGCGT